MNSTAEEPLTALTFDAIPSRRALYRVDRFHDKVIPADYGVPAYHNTADCDWPPCDNDEIVVRGEAVEVTEPQAYDECGGRHLDLCADADAGHARPDRVCPRCAPTLTT